MERSEVAAIVAIVLFLPFLASGVASAAEPPSVQWPATPFLARENASSFVAWAVAALGLPPPQSTQRPWIDSDSIVDQYYLTDGENATWPEDHWIFRVDTLGRAFYEFHYAYAGPLLFVEFHHITIPNGSADSPSGRQALLRDWSSALGIPWSGTERVSGYAVGGSYEVAGKQVPVWINETVMIDKAGGSIVFHANQLFARFVSVASEIDYLRIFPWVQWPAAPPSFSIDAARNRARSLVDSLPWNHGLTYVNVSREGCALLNTSSLQYYYVFLYSGLDDFQKPIGNRVSVVVDPWTGTAVLLEFESTVMEGQGNGEVDSTFLLGISLAAVATALVILTAHLVRRAKRRRVSPPPAR